MQTRAERGELGIVQEPGGKSAHPRDFEGIRDQIRVALHASVGAPFRHAVIVQSGGQSEDQSFDGFRGFVDATAQILAEEAPELGARDWHGGIPDLVAQRKLREVA